MAFRSAKVGYYASRYKKFGNLCYVIGALRAFIGHHNLDLRIMVNIFRDLKSNNSTSESLVFSDSLGYAIAHTISFHMIAL
ncbi:Uncharacterized protein TCM_014020 [Theobroma cacao]|uniref:Uncharacterized protein n=1 Tax=Theobroma cacao TaxID=3641 RepID=A0A061FXS7_THECC|nr:Uncharacterized protein TCM_014020 [Theobroma cacao]